MACGDCRKIVHRHPQVTFDRRAKFAAGAKLLLAFVFKGHLDLRPVGLDLAFSDLHVEFDNFCDAKVSQTLRSTFYSCACSLFPGVGAGADQFDNLINAISHGFLRCDCFISTLIGSFGSDSASDQ